MVTEVMINAIRTCNGKNMVAIESNVLTLPMLRLLSSKAQER